MKVEVECPDLLNPTISPIINPKLGLLLPVL